MTARPKTDALLIFAILFAVGFGLVLVFSSSQLLAQEDHGSPYHFVLRQSVWASLGVAFMVFLWRSDYHHWLKLSPLLMLVTLVLLAAVYLFPQKNHTWRWIHYRSYQFQPSELAKYVMVMFLAYSLPRRLQAAAGKGRGLNRSKTFRPYLLLLAVVTGLVMFQPHLGNTAIIAVSALILLWLAGMKLGRVFLFSLPCLALVAVMVLGFGYQRARIDSYYNSLLHPLDGAYQVRQSSLALAGGGLVGRGLGEGGQKRFFLPEAHTDFIFASAGEEVGFAPLSMLLFFYLFLGWKSCQIACRSRDDSGFYLAIGVGLVLSVNAVVNLGVVLALLPVTGVTLPFVSYGGSSLFVNLVGIGLLLSVMRESYVWPRSKLLNGGLVPVWKRSDNG